MRKNLILFILLLAFGVISCNSSDKSELKEPTKKDASKKVYVKETQVDLGYFFPLKPEPVVYAYSLDNNPLSERFLKITTAKTKFEEYRILLEHYNSDLILTEGLTIDVSNGFKTLNQAVASKGTKFEAHLSSPFYFPASDTDTSRFISDFPTSNDSLVMLIEVDRYFDGTQPIKLADSVVNCKVIKEHWRTTTINIVTRQEQVKQFSSDLYFAKNMGKVAFIPNGQKDTMKLQRVISIKDWELLNKH